MEAIFILIFLPANCSSFLWQRNKNFQSRELQCVTWILHFYLNLAVSNRKKKKKKRAQRRAGARQGGLVLRSLRGEMVTVERGPVHIKACTLFKAAVWSLTRNPTSSAWSQVLLISGLGHNWRMDRIYHQFCKVTSNSLKKWPSHLKFKYIFLTALYNRVYSKSMLSTLAAH